MFRNIFGFFTLYILFIAYEKKITLRVATDFLFKANTEESIRIGKLVLSQHLQYSKYYKRSFSFRFCHKAFQLNSVYVYGIIRCEWE